MNARQDELILELRKTKWEIEQALKDKEKDEWLAVILQEELSDVEKAMEKIRHGSFGQCEVSGELLPEDVLKVLPTTRTVKDAESLAHFYRKPISM